MSRTLAIAAALSASTRAAFDAAEIPVFDVRYRMWMRGSTSYSRNTSIVALDGDASSHRHSSQFGYAWRRADSMHARSHCGSVL